MVSHASLDMKVFISVIQIQITSVKIALPLIVLTCDHCPTLLFHQYYLWIISCCPLNVVVSASQHNLWCRVVRWISTLAVSASPCQRWTCSTHWSFYFSCRYSMGSYTPVAKRKVIVSSLIIHEHPNPLSHPLSLHVVGHLFLSCIMIIVSCYLNKPHCAAAGEWFRALK